MKNNFNSGQEIDPKLVVKIDDSESDASVKVTNQDEKKEK